MSAESSIYLAETSRIRGHLVAALQEARLQGTVPPEAIATLDDRELVDKMRLWRIWAVTLMSLYGKEWNGTTAVGLLKETKGVLKTYYSEPLVVRAAKAMRTDPENHEYQMRAEMLRDVGKFLVCVAGLTGNPACLNHAVHAFGKAASEAQEGTSAHAVATMEREITQRKNGQKIDWGIFRPAYQTAVVLSPEAGGWDRLAAVSWWFAKEALIAGQKQDFWYGIGNLRGACRAGKVNWAIRYPLKEAISTVSAVSRRLTAPRFNCPDNLTAGA